MIPYSNHYTIKDGIRRDLHKEQFVNRSVSVCPQPFKFILLLSFYINTVPRTGLEPARLPATPSKWCVYQFRHLGRATKVKK